MTSHSENNKRIAKNTLMLYGRMLFGMFVSLYTSRVVLNVLGVEDYGIYGAVGGFVGMFSLISGSLSSSVSRFLTFELGRGDKESLKQAFSTSLLIHISLALVILLLSETFGVWFLNNRMENIPADRLYAANWLLQFSVASFILGTLSVPYNAALISREKMDVFAAVGVTDIIMKFCIVLALQLFPYNVDKLIIYALMGLCWSLVVQFFYIFYCGKHFDECRVKPLIYRSKLKDMTGFASWTFIGCAADLLKGAGVDLLLFQFFGPIVMAAKTISGSVNKAVSSFASNFMTALTPQIIKSYAARDLKYTLSLVERGSRFSFYVMMVFVMPIIFETEFILKIWLKTYPEHCVNFVRLVLVISLIEILSSTLIKLQTATGKIRNYQLVVGGMLLMNFPLSYMVLNWGCQPEATLIVAILLGICCLLLRLLFLKKMVGLSIYVYLKNVCLNVLIVTLFTAIPTFVVFKLMHDSGLIKFVLVVSVSVFSSLLSILFAGCTKNERNFIVSKMYVLKKKFLQ